MLAYDYADDVYQHNKFMLYLFQLEIGRKILILENLQQNNHLFLTLKAKFLLLMVKTLRVSGILSTHHNF